MVVAVDICGSPDTVHLCKMSRSGHSHFLVVIDRVIVRLDKFVHIYSRLARCCNGSPYLFLNITSAKSFEEHDKAVDVFVIYNIKQLVFNGYLFRPCEDRGKDDNVHIRIEKLFLNTVQCLAYKASVRFTDNDCYQRSLLVHIVQNDLSAHQNIKAILNKFVILYHVSPKMSSFLETELLILSHKGHFSSLSVH